MLAFACGCRTTFPTINAKFREQSFNYKYIQVLPICLEAAGNIDRSQTTNELKIMANRVGEALTEDFQSKLRSKGYLIKGAVPIFHFGVNTNLVPPDITKALEATRTDLFRNLLLKYSASPNEDRLTFGTNSTLSFWQWMAHNNLEKCMLEPNPFHYQATEALTNLLIKFGATNVDAVLVVETKVFLESDQNYNKRTLWNWTGGGAVATAEVGFNLALCLFESLGRTSVPEFIWVDPFWHSDNSIQHSVALVDVHTREVLWFNQQNFKRMNPDDANDLAESVNDTLTDLPSMN